MVAVALADGAFVVLIVVGVAVGVNLKYTSTYWSLTQQLSYTLVVACSESGVCWVNCFGSLFSSWSSWLHQYVCASLPFSLLFLYAMIFVVVAVVACWWSSMSCSRSSRCKCSFNCTFAPVKGEVSCERTRKKRMRKYVTQWMVCKVNGDSWIELNSSC